MNEFPPRLPCAALHGSERCEHTSVQVVKIVGEVRVALCGSDMERLKDALAERDRKIGQAAMAEAKRRLHVETGTTRGSSDG